MSSYAVQHVVGPRLTGYINEGDLETFLRNKFPSSQYPGKAYDRFDIKASQRFWIRGIMLTKSKSTRMNAITSGRQWKFRIIDARRRFIFNQNDNIHITFVQLTEYDPISVIRDEYSLLERMQKTSKEKFSLLSLHQEFSLDPLQCSESALNSIVSEWNVTAIFFDVLLRFGNQHLIFEDSSGFKETYQLPNGSFEFAYQLMYIEPNGRKSPKDPWSFRQTVVYHGYDSLHDRNRIIVLHPKENSAAQEKLESVATSRERDILATHPLNVHLLIISSYMIHWPNHSESLAKELQEIRDQLLVIDIKDSQFDPSDLQKLRNLEDKIVTRTCRCLASTKKIIASLIDLNQNLPADTADFAAVHRQLLLFNDRLDSFLDSAQTLGERVRATLGLLTNILELQNQNNSDKMQKHMLHLTGKNVDDNATVRFITVCTMIYLPASFMATLLGMNLFEFRNESGGLRVSPTFWIYVALTLPLTVLTVGSYWFFKARHDRRRKMVREGEGGQAA
ncbi:hypothetical protein EJ04DRAFT_560183 [Polyplosphaeria fusca]|uniref:CorA-like transporter domain-containing protein n=1 Tax=Polyplosphaeria fusca TaxID=682080 RepID=A0A9P4R9L0_9PLEO|nr:hypothetical protein EJ04DRAFT_560183 [Polyplosphaeria fusca]